MNLFLLREALHSVALSHEEGHDCDVCKAAAGDKDAWLRLLVAHSGLGDDNTREASND